MIRSLWPAFNLFWDTPQPDAFWAPDELRWDFAEIYELPLRARPQLKWSHLKCGLTQALVSFPAVSENAAEEFSWEAADK